MDYTPTILKNKGIPTNFNKVTKTGEKWERVLNESGELENEVLYVRFTNNAICDIELHFGSLEEWQEALEKNPVTTVRHTLALCIGRQITEVGEMMQDGEVVMYSNVIGTAWSIANGVDPTIASQLLKQSDGLASEQKLLLNQAIENQMKEANSPGPSGTDSGPKRASRSKNSGK